jgi:DNA helicase II / ATP-dependent DNA helicase PcrA
MTPTPEQSAIVDFAKSSQENLIISALAGAAKTTTLELICKALPPRPILSLAFNKRIAEEMTRRLPGHVKAQTMNSIGHGVWGTAVGKRLFVDKDKMRNLLKERIDEYPRSEQMDLRDAWIDIMDALRQAKIQGYIPMKVPNAKPLIQRQDFFQSLEEELPPHIEKLIDTILVDSIALAYAGTIDFDDQIYMPTLFGGSFPRYPLVMVDEAQDLSPLNHAMLAKLATQRFIAVGDPYQSIYGFRGAVASGMSQLQTAFSMTELPLNVSFRCPERIVERARKRVPHMEWFKPGGHFSEPGPWAPQGNGTPTAIICRNNAPLFKLALDLLRAGRGVHLVGTDLGPNLVKLLQKLGPESLTHDQTIQAIDRWQEGRLKKSRSPGAVIDRADCLRVFANFGKSLGEAIAFASNAFQSSGSIQLLSGHKAKGGEWNTVYHLDPWRIPSKWANRGEAIVQELNLEYVITTRSKYTLFEVNADEMEDLNVLGK